MKKDKFKKNVRVHLNEPKEIKEKNIKRLEYLAIGKHPGNLTDAEIAEMNELKDIYGRI